MRRDRGVFVLKKRAVSALSVGDIVYLANDYQFEFGKVDKYTKAKVIQPYHSSEYPIDSVIAVEILEGLYICEVCEFSESDIRGGCLMTAIEVVDDRLARIRRAIQKAKEKQRIATLVTDEVYRIIDEFGIDAEEIPSKAENAGNLEEAISCYICYNEYDVDDIIMELREAVGQI